MDSHTAPPTSLLIAGSPTGASRSAALLDAAGITLRDEGFRLDRLALRELPSHALLHAQADDPVLRQALARVAAADVVVLATPLYKVAYSGLLKCFLDLLPRDAFAGKWVWPLATGGSAAHLLAIDHALRPVLDSLGARRLLRTVFATDAQVSLDPAARHGAVSDEIQARLLGAVGEAEFGRRTVGLHLPRWPRVAAALDAARCSA